MPCFFPGSEAIENDPTWVLDMSSSALSKMKRVGILLKRSLSQFTSSKSKIRLPKTTSAPSSAESSCSGFCVISLSVNTQISSPGHCAAAFSAALRYNSLLKVSKPAIKTTRNVLAFGSEFGTKCLLGTSPVTFSTSKGVAAERRPSAFCCTVLAGRSDEGCRGERSANAGVEARADKTFGAPCSAGMRSAVGDHESTGA
mmetsp:Transcript_53272/g.125923  ORF Transcript_53272/g.125923 Transcript_53272/m.125923 type:complete len:200 (+) Transcript_53272:1311-1910(+)|eukprot:2428331-Rhodomonas_salina.3